MNRILQELLDEVPGSVEADAPQAGPPQEDGADANTLGLRIAAVFIILSAGLLGGVPPLFLKSLRDQNSLLTFLIRAFAAGVILALALVHIVPEAVEELADLGGVTYPIGGTCVLFGIIIMVFIEHSAHIMYVQPHAHGHGGNASSHGHSSSSAAAPQLPGEETQIHISGAAGVVGGSHHSNGCPSGASHKVVPFGQKDGPGYAGSPSPAQPGGALVALDADCGGYVPPLLPPPPPPPPPPAAPPPPVPLHATLDPSDHCCSEQAQEQQPQHVQQRLQADRGLGKRGAAGTPAEAPLSVRAPGGFGRHSAGPAPGVCTGLSDRSGHGGGGSGGGPLHASSTPLLGACDRASSDGGGAAGGPGCSVCAAGAVAGAIAAGEGDGAGLQRALLLHCQPGHAHECVSRASAPNWMSAVEVTVEGGQPLRMRIVAYLFELGCIFHSFIIGISLGVNQTSLSQVQALLIALSFHQALEGLSLASVINGGGFSTAKSAFMIGMYSITCPAGVAVGIAIASSYDPESVKARAAQGILNGVSGGMLLYISLVQLVAEDMGKYLGGSGAGSGGHSHAAHPPLQTPPIAAGPAKQLGAESVPGPGTFSQPAVKTGPEGSLGVLEGEPPAGLMPCPEELGATGAVPVAACHPGKHELGMGYRIRVPSFLAFTAGAASMCLLAVWA